MKTFSFLVAILIGLSQIAAAQPTSSAGDENHMYYTKQFYLPGGVQGIIVRTATGQELASMKISGDVVLSVYSSDRDEVPMHRTEFHGRISIRVKPHVEDHNPIGAVELMADAPFRLDLADAIVSAETPPNK